MMESGAIVVVATHRTGVLTLATHVLVLARGRVQRFGRRRTYSPRSGSSTQSRPCCGVAINCWYRTP